MAGRLPIIYVRGFAGGQGGIDRAVDDPFYGFNEGSTHIRVGKEGRPRFYQFEGPMLRLMIEHDYELRVRGSQLQELVDAEPGTMTPGSVWVYRFYDKSSGGFGAEPLPYEIGRSAEGLAEFIALVREKTDGRPRVNLVAHSMGGLICRTALQCDIDRPEEVVSKLCTIGTPHGGIDPKLGGGIGDWLIEHIGPNGSDVFSPEHMKEYMLPDGYDEKLDVNPQTEKWDPRRMVGTFPVSRVLSVVGTNAKDYDVARGLSARVMGEQSDGLVAIKNAYVHSSARAYVHRSHSGRYGLVNSEETYQNLERFLFGTLRVQIELHGLDREKLGDRVWQADARLAIRKLPVLIHEQTAEHHCPVDLVAEAEKTETPMAPVPLITTFLIPGKLPKARYALHLTVHSLVERGGVFGFGDHLEQIADWEDSLVVDVVMRDDKADRVDWEWNSTIKGRIAEAEQLANRLTWDGPAAGGGAPGWREPLPLPDTAREMLGDEARLELAVTPWD
jgi:pimeloyl-ACP methyl ester carboxylesterase